MAWRWKRRWKITAILVILLAGSALAGWVLLGPVPWQPGVALDAVSLQAQWPWPDATRETLYPGVTRWIDRSSRDGTALYLLKFDRTVNPGLTLRMYDQDQDDAAPFDNAADFWHRGVGQVTKELQQRGDGPVLAACNGLFFTISPSWQHRYGVASHLSPVVLNGNVHYPNAGNHRWTFGIHQTGSQAVYRVMHLPTTAQLAANFTYAAGAAQCLILEGKPLALQPYPAQGESPLPQPVPSTPAEAGHIPIVDHMRTSRTSLGWSRDHTILYMLVVKEPDTEVGSIEAFHRRVPVMGGWMVADLQQFWRSLGVWGAVNLDGGDITQLLMRRPDGRFDLVPSRWGTNAQWLTLPPDLADAPGGGTLMYFYVQDVTPGQGGVRANER